MKQVFDPKVRETFVWMAEQDELESMTRPTEVQE